MFTLYVCRDGLKDRSTIHLIDETGALAYSGDMVHDALSWLCEQGELDVVAITDDGPELFLIEPCGAPSLQLPSLSLRRQHLGRCCDLPRLPGLDPDPKARAGLLAECPVSAAKRRRRPQQWMRRATSP